MKTQPADVTVRGSQQNFSNSRKPDSNFLRLDCYGYWIGCCWMAMALLHLAEQLTLKGISQRLSWVHGHPPPGLLELLDIALNKIDAKPSDCRGCICGTKVRVRHCL